MRLLLALLLSACGSGEPDSDGDRTSTASSTSSSTETETTAPTSSTTTSTTATSSSTTTADTTWPATDPDARRHDCSGIDPADLAGQRAVDPLGGLRGHDEVRTRLGPRCDVEGVAAGHAARAVEVDRLKRPRRPEEKQLRAAGHV